MHLVINQSTDRTEQVTTACIDKLYNLSKSNTLDNTSYLRGAINAPTAYEDAVIYLNTMWGPDLVVTAGAYYIRFQDPNVLSVLLNAGIGDGVGVNTADAASVSGKGSIFKGNTNITSFDEIGYFTTQNSAGWSFSGCTNLVRINLNNVSNISSDFFRGNMTNLEFFNGPGSVSGIWHIAEGETAIGYWAISGLPKLKEVYLADSCQTVGGANFQSCPALTKIHFGTNISRIEKANAFDNTPIEHIYVKDFERWCSTVTQLTNIMRSSGHYYENDVEVTSYTFSSSVTQINNYACYNGAYITTVGIPSSIISIGTDAFKNCTGLQRVDITDLDAWLDITFGNEDANPLKNAHNLYLNDSLVTSVDFTDKNEVKNYVFIAATCLTSATLPNTITAIGTYAFAGCTNLALTSLPTSITSIGTGAFKNCTAVNISDLALPNLTSIEKYAFGGDEGEACTITTVSNLGSITSIPDACFQNVTALTSVTIPNTVTSIGFNSFRGTGLTSINFPSSVTTIGTNSFYKCSGLTSVTIPDTVTTIGQEAFRGCSHLTTVDIGTGVTKINTRAFYIVPITSFTIHATTPPTLGNNPFDGGSSWTIYVPPTSVETYKTAWAAYASRIQAIPTT